MYRLCLFTLALNGTLNLARLNFTGCPLLLDGVSPYSELKKTKIKIDEGKIDIEGLLSLQMENDDYINCKVTTLI